jgi:hypothetical protein
VREALGIGMEGDTGLGHSVCIHFRADLTRWLVARPPYMMLIEGPGGPGMLLAVDGPFPGVAVHVAVRSNAPNACGGLHV